MHLIRRHSQELFRRRNPAGEQGIGIRRAALTLGKARPEEVLELAAPLTSEDAAQAITGDAEQIGDTAVRGVMEVGHPSE